MLVVLDPLSFWKDFHSNDIRVQGPVLMLERLNQEFLVETLNVHGSLIYGQTRHIQSTLEESAFFDAKNQFTQL